MDINTVERSLSHAQAPYAATPWQLFSTHGAVLLYIAMHRRALERDIASAVGVTPRQVGRIIHDLVATGHLTVQSAGRRNSYHVNLSAPLPNPLSPSITLRQLLPALIADRDGPTVAHEPLGLYAGTGAATALARGYHTLFCMRVDGMEQRVESPN